MLNSERLKVTDYNYASYTLIIVCIHDLTVSTSSYILTRLNKLYSVLVAPILDQELFIYDRLLIREGGTRGLLIWTPTKPCLSHLDTSAHAQTLPSRLDYNKQA